ncbi:hypothetical protein GCM10025859_06310 [Alicyclobacillus fastidiosus]|nr:hypothetical protein GCM10025859_06310 [Alicyclobacillus fastidiosus]
MRKILNALPKKLGTISGQNVLIQWKYLNIMKFGIIVTSPGIISVHKVIIKNKFLPGARNRANAKAANDDTKTCPIMAGIVMINVFLK